MEEWSVLLPYRYFSRPSCFLSQYKWWLYTKGCNPILTRTVGSINADHFLHLFSFFSSFNFLLFLTSPCFLIPHGFSTLTDEEAGGSPLTSPPGGTMFVHYYSGTMEWCTTAPVSAKPCCSGFAAIRGFGFAFPSRRHVTFALSRLPQHHLSCYLVLTFHRVEILMLRAFPNIYIFLNKVVRKSQMDEKEKYEFSKLRMDTK